MPFTEFFSFARHNFYIYHYLSHRQHCWRVTSQPFQCFGDLNLNQRRLEQDPGLGGPVGGLRTVFIKFEIIIFYFANWIQKHSGMISCNIFQDYMEAQDQIQGNCQIMASQTLTVCSVIWGTQDTYTMGPLTTMEGKIDFVSAAMLQAKNRDIRLFTTEKVCRWTQRPEYPLQRKAYSILRGTEHCRTGYSTVTEHSPPDMENIY